MSAISTHLEESGVINAPLAKAWEVLSSNSFLWWNLVESSELTSGASPQTLDATIKLTFKDGHIWFIQIRELSSIHNSITFELIAAEPSNGYSSAIHTISLKRISGSSQSFVEWVTDFSSDATAETVIDSSFKRQDAFADLAAAAASL